MAIYVILNPFFFAPDYIGIEINLITLNVYQSNK